MSRYQSEEHMLRDALLVQDGCNISGITHAFAEALSYMTQTMQLDEEAKRCHPATILFVNKIAAMMGGKHDSMYEEAYNTAKKAEGG